MVKSMAIYGPGDCRPALSPIDRVIVSAAISAMNAISEAEETATAKAMSELRASGLVLFVAATDVLLRYLERKDADWLMSHDARRLFLLIRKERQAIGY
jgi:hypothetical protein